MWIKRGLQILFAPVLFVYGVVIIAWLWLALAIGGSEDGV